MRDNKNSSGATSLFREEDVSVQPGTNKKRQMVMIAHRIPYPPNKGDKIRSFNQLKYLSEKGWDIHLLTHADELSELKHKEVLKRYCKTVTIQLIPILQKKVMAGLKVITGVPLTVNYFYSKVVQAKFDEIIKAYTIHAVFCFSSPTAEYVFRSRAIKEKKTKLIMDLIDVDSVKWRQYAEYKKSISSLIFWLESRLLSNYESLIVNRFDAITLVSPDEVKLLKSIMPCYDKVHAVGNGVDLGYFRKQSEEHCQRHSRDEISLVFFGRMDYYPNEDAVIWFAENVLPLISSEINARFCIVGANPSRQVLALSNNPRIEVTGEVEDIRPYVWDGDICVFPIRVARGIQNKVLEAMAMCKPIVASLQAFEGIDAKSGDDLLAVEMKPDKFAGAILELCGKSEFAERLAFNARRLVHNQYSWEKQLNLMESLIKCQ